MNLDQILDAVERNSISVEYALKSLHDRTKNSPSIKSTPPSENVETFNAPSLKSELIIDLVSILADVLEIDRSDISPAVSVLDYGLDSVSATEYMVSLNRKAGINHPPTAFFECDTLDELADVLLRIYLKELLVFYKKDTPTIQILKAPTSTPAKSEPREFAGSAMERGQLENYDNPYSKDSLLHHLEDCWQSAKLEIERRMRQ